MKRTPLPPRSKPLRRVAIARTAYLARSVRPSVRKAKTRVGEFSPKTRKLIYARFNQRCAACGDPMVPGNRTAQHRRARGSGGSSDPVTVHVANGVGVHQVPCHERIEANPTQALRDGFRIPQGSHPRDWPIRLWTGESVYLTDSGGYIEVAAAEPEEKP